MYEFILLHNKRPISSVALKQEPLFLRVPYVDWEVILVWVSSGGLDGLEPSFTVWGLTGCWSRTSTWATFFYPCGLLSFGKLAHFFHASISFLTSREQQVRAGPDEQAFISLCLCHICYHLIGQNKSHDQAQRQCGRPIQKHGYYYDYCNTIY